MWKEILELIVLGSIFVGVLGLTYMVTKKIGSMNKEMHPHKNMQIVEVLSLMQGQYLYIVKAGQTYHLMGCSQKGNITYLKELDKEELNLEAVKSISFQEHFMHFMKGKKINENNE